MHTRHTITMGSALGALVALPAPAADITVKLELPEITTGRYERPYVAVFLEKDDDSFVRSLSLWHMVKGSRGGGGGDRYLNELREWWRSSGTTSQLPIDGVSGATRSPGTHELVFSQGKAPLNQLPPGKYQLVVEVAREVKGQRGEGPPGGGPRGEGAPAGGEGAARGPRGQGGGKDALESIHVAFDWPVKKPTTVNAKGKTELGAVALTLNP